MCAFLIVIISYERTKIQWRKEGRRAEESRIFELFGLLRGKLEYSAGDHCDSAPDIWDIASGVRTRKLSVITG